MQWEEDRCWLLHISGEKHKRKCVFTRVVGVHGSEGRCLGTHGYRKVKNQINHNWFMDIHDWIMTIPVMKLWISFIIELWISSWIMDKIYTISIIQVWKPIIQYHRYPYLQNMGSHNNISKLLHLQPYLPMTHNSIVNVRSEFWIYPQLLWIIDIHHWTMDIHNWIMDISLCTAIILNLELVLSLTEWGRRQPGLWAVTSVTVSTSTLPSSKCPSRPVTAVDRFPAWHATLTGRALILCPPCSGTMKREICIFMDGIS